MSSRTPSNVELFGWGWQILRKLPEYQKARPLLRNPLLRAFMQRGLEDLVIGFSAVSDPGDLGEANLSLARRAEAGGDILGSLSFGQAAQQAFALANDIPSQTEATLLVASAQLKAGNHEKAGDDLKGVFKHYDALSPRGKGWYFAVAAQVAAENRKYGKASSLFERAVAQYMGQNAIAQAGEVHAAWAGTKVSSGDIAGAQQQLQQAIALSSDDPSRQADYLYKLASVQVSGGDQDKARETLEQFLVVAPEDVRTKEVKTMLQLESGKTGIGW
jgi:tetratricopeptide (TPR) repeat protein